jgi:hypothetical protein
MWSLALVGGAVIALALLAAYVPTIYIRKSNKILKLLQQIAINTGEPFQHEVRKDWVAAKTQ